MHLEKRIKFIRCHFYSSTVYRPPVIVIEREKFEILTKTSDLYIKNPNPQTIILDAQNTLFLSLLEGGVNS